MKFGDLLQPEHVVLETSASSLPEVVTIGLRALGASFEDGLGREADAVVRANEQVIVAAVVDEGAGEAAAIVTTAVPFVAPLPAPDAVARALVLFRIPGSIKTVKVQWFSAVIRAVRDDELKDRLLGARTPSAVLGITGLMALPLRRQLVVEDVMRPLELRVFGHTPIQEVVDLIVRKGVPSVPVVGEEHDLLGIIDARDALRELLPDRIAKEDDDPTASPGRAAKDVMNRAVMSVGESQPLFEAAHLLVKRDLEQLPVVRDGRLVGFVSREQLLKTLHEL